MVSTGAFQTWPKSLTQKSNYVLQVCTTKLGISGTTCTCFRQTVNFSTAPAFYLFVISPANYRLNLKHKPFVVRFSFFFKCRLCLSFTYNNTIHFFYSSSKFYVSVCCAIIDCTGQYIDCECYVPHVQRDCLPSLVNDMGTAWPSVVHCPEQER